MHRAAATPHPEPASQAAEATSVELLGLLPDGHEKRRFLLDCTGCHRMDMAHAFPDGRVRSRAEWREVVERMLSYAGWRSDFPVISAGRDPAATAEWLVRHWSDLPTAARAGTRTAAVDTAAAEVREYPYPHPTDLPHDLAVDDDGQVIITGMFTHRMLVLDPADGEYRDVPIPVPEANPRALDLDEDGDWWVLLGAPNRVARYDPVADEWRSWDIGLYGHSIRPDRQGRTWFNG
ncbi:MAG: hypothetical protein ACODAE_08885, partial [Gemmatimonadota bacterium]